MKAKECAMQLKDVLVLPEPCLKIKALLDNNVSDFESIASIIELDPVLASKILKIANSSLFQFPHEVDSIEKALLLLGQQQVFQVVVAYSAALATSSLKNCSVDLESFWEQSIYCALFAKYLSEELNLSNADSLYLSGLLHNLGELVAAEVLPKVVDELNRSVTTSSPTIQQQQLLGFSFVECTVELLRLWDLPERLIAPIEDIEINRIDPVNKARVCLHIASAYAYYLTHSQKGQLSLSLHAQASTWLKLSPDALESIKNRVVIDSLSILEVFYPSLGHVS